MTDKNKYIFLSGLPRAGSNMLSAILNQNPLIYSEGVSAMCRMLWNLVSSMENDLVTNELAAVRKNEEVAIRRMCNSLFDGYYGLEGRVIFDKNASWTLYENVGMLTKYVTPNPKIVVLERKILDVAKSYINVYLQNGFSQGEAEKIVLNLYGRGTNPVMRPVAGLIYSKMNNNGEFLYVDYDELISDPQEQVNRIYEFCELEPYSHRYTDLHMEYLEDESVVLKGLMGVRPEIGRRKIDIELSEDAMAKIEKMQDLLDRVSTQKHTQELVEESVEFYKYNTF